MSPEERDEIKRHFSVVAEDLKAEIRLVAEGVAGNSDRIDRLEGKVDHLNTELRAFRDETRLGFTELRSQIKLSYSELDRRLTTLEEGHALLTARVESIEAKLAS